ncbi:hypothetical protein AUEXF2481DRAFT_76186 [Aureobasidium subglaciale EXF-2481]|uniref:Ubiquitin-like domain-containing protein n=1 Tax=Aureobasidium subglaciale (strain EXF-2481) TaxID=1043005 RepID=A0A074YPH6_AURSE|nr:uncharacterized protein AUEXF2481DRAFT_76186 [Aureobasidium subglaciale EXF-2481]KAI5194593.1 hypothetical protein E4T38_09501 [Aureobasidium subglaciale]KAI5213760.1 hypothetical protein E4T40_09446 [Aureobasidium subglaciale]KAI5215796.1 hypothetical protein E4T41_09453 [Aureobasidium subglaciale]KAI5253872.1 hypothetical protein E4T46_09408 [Aureobasidium subglaciale]KEQ99585.1 hypothetical protein AUEXF2481DRAFT_76186 [Aureobasidium subglaciale EXF-2481]
MDSHTQHDPKQQGNMAAEQPASFGQHDPRSQPPPSIRPGTTNAQQTPISQQAFWSNPAFVAQYYQQAQTAQQVPSFNGAFQMPYQQDMQPFPAASFDNSNHQTTFDPATQMMQNWHMANSAQNRGFAPGMSYPAQQYSGKQDATQQVPRQQQDLQQMYHQPAPFSRQQAAQTPTEVENDHRVNGASSNEISDFDMDDPSAQLMGELQDAIAESARSPTPSIKEAGVSKSDVNTMGFPSLPSFMNYEAHASNLRTNDEHVSGPQNDQDLDHETFKSLGQDDLSAKTGQFEATELADQVDQVVANLRDEEMQDSDLGEHSSTPEYDETTTSDDEDLDTGADIDVDIEDYADDDSSTQRESSVLVSDEDTAQDDTAADSAADRVVTDDEEVEDYVSENEIEDGDVSDAVSCSREEAHDSAVESPQEVEFEGYSLTMSPFKAIKKKLAKKADKDLHNKAVKLQPHHLPAHRYWVAVLMHTVAPQKAKVEKDFVWLKGNKSNTVETMWNEYRNVTTEEQHQILFCGKVPQFTDSLEELDIFDDKLVVFRAAKQEVIVID